MEEKDEKERGACLDCVTDGTLPVSTITLQPFRDFALFPIKLGANLHSLCPILQSNKNIQNYI